MALQHAEYIKETGSMEAWCNTNIDYFLILATTLECGLLSDKPGLGFSLFDCEVPFAGLSIFDPKDRVPTHFLDPCQYKPLN